MSRSGKSDLATIVSKQHVDRTENDIDNLTFSVKYTHTDTFIFKCRVK